MSDFSSAYWLGVIQPLVQPLAWEHWHRNLPSGNVCGAASPHTLCLLSVWVYSWNVDVSARSVSHAQHHVCICVCVYLPLSDATTQQCVYLAVDGGAGSVPLPVLAVNAEEIFTAMLDYKLDLMILVTLLNIPLGSWQSCHHGTVRLHRTMEINKINKVAPHFLEVNFVFNISTSLVLCMYKKKKAANKL